MSTVATPGVKFLDKYNSPAVLLEVPTDTKVGDVISTAGQNGKVYGPYTVAAVVKGDTISLATCWKAAGKASSKPMTKAEMEQALAEMNVKFLKALNVIETLTTEKK